MPETVSNQTVSETTEKKTRKRKELVNPFQTIKISHQQYQSLGKRKVVRASGVEIEKDTHMVYPTFESYDLWEEVQQCKDLAGVDYMKKLLMTGQAKPEDFYDDGHSGVDTTVFPDTVHEAKQMAEQGNAQLAAIAKALGVDDEEGVTQKTLEQLLEAKVKEIYQKQQAAQAAAKEGDDK